MGELRMYGAIFTIAGANWLWGPGVAAALAFTGWALTAVCEFVAYCARAEG